jgi:hypothetical protein
MPDWLNILDLGIAARNVRTDIFGDWHRDPWDWPELEWVAGTRPDLLAARLEHKDAFAAFPLDVAKENFFTRPAIVFDIVDRLAIQALVDRVSARLLDGAPPWMYSWRLSRSKPQAGHYSNMDDEWQLYRHHLIRSSVFYDLALTTDIVSCFASIPLSRLVTMVQQRAAGGVLTDRLCQAIEQWDGLPRRTGVPQRANFSSVLVNAYLRPIDDLLAFHGAVGGSSILARLVPQGAAAMRWVDDVWLFGSDAGRLRSVQLELQDVARDLGLNLNAAKTELLEGNELVAKARRLEHSAVDVALDENPPSRSELDALVARVLEHPASANRTTIRFATVRIRRIKAWDLFQPLAEKAHLMPQGASALARLFRDSGYWRDLGSWYVWYAASVWSKISASVAQLGTMFPSDGPVANEVADYLERALGERQSLSMFALAAQRLAAWRPNSARLLFRELAGSCHHPQERRILALAGLNAGEERAWAAGLLREHVENRSILEFLEGRNFVPVAPGADFRGY